VWGSNLYGDLGNGTSTHGKEPAGDYVDVPQPVPGLHEVSYIAAGGPDDAAVLRNGTVYAWGQNASGQLGDGTRVEKEVPVQVQHLSGVRSVAIGAFPSSGGHMLALLDNGTVMALGRNDQGQLGDGTTVDSPTPVSVSRLSHVVAISADISHSLALTSNGVLYAFGGNEYGQLGVGSGPESCEGRPCSRVPVALAPRPVTSMSAGFRYSTAVVRGTPYAWGWNTQGQLGDGTTVQKDTPTPVAGVHGASMVAASWYYTFAGLDGPGPPRPVALFRAGSALNLSWLPGGTTSRWHVSWRVAPRGTWGPEAVLPPTARSHSIAGMSFTVPYEVRLSPGGGNGRVLQWGEADPWLWNSGMPPGETTEGEEEETEEQEPPTAPALAPVTPVPPAPAPHAAETAAPTSAAPSPTRMLGG
ncbi:MAG TPA: hypothetical protein VKG62_06440, partial [Solirubrobacteraceae bacterium]|nr:hypothetical protein [Solirubrobacteraceae bacterium]